MNPSLNKMIINKDKLEHSKKCYDILYPEFKLKDNKVTKSKDIFLSSSLNKNLHNALIEFP